MVTVDGIYLVRSVIVVVVIPFQRLTSHMMWRLGDSEDMEWRRGSMEYISWRSVTVVSVIKVLKFYFVQVQRALKVIQRHS